MQMLRLFLLFLFVLSNLAVLKAGELKPVTYDVGCVNIIRPGRPLLPGIHQGKLPAYVMINRCDGMWLGMRIKNGLMQMAPVQKSFVPMFKPRGKGLATPDGRVTIADKHILEAWLTRPTERYDHAIMGDAFEAGGLAVILANKKRIELLLDEKSVFEDRIVRLVDLDGDGRLELVVVHTYLDRGAALAVYKVKDEKIVPVAETTPIGLPHRWLNPVAAADFDGDGNIEIAFVETPHIGGLLKVARLEGGDRKYLRIVGELRGFSNHSIGQRELLQSVTFDWDGDKLPDLILPGADRTTIKAVSMADGKLKVIAEIEIGGIIDSQLVAADLDGDGRGEVLLVTKDARLLSFSPL